MYRTSRYNPVNHISRRLSNQVYPQHQDSFKNEVPCVMCTLYGQPEKENVFGFDKMRLLK